jgi:hypothetical protein
MVLKKNQSGHIWTTLYVSVYIYIYNVYRQKPYFLFYFYVNYNALGVAIRLLAGRDGTGRAGPGRASQNVRTDAEAHPATCSKLPVLFPESKAAETWCWPLTFI